MGIKIKSASLSKGYYYGEYLQHKPGLEVDVTGDTTEEEALDMIENLLDAWHNKKVGQPASAPASQLPFVIDPKQYDALEIAIDNANSLEALNAIKLSNPIFPAKLLDFYNEKRKKLIDG